MPKEDLFITIPTYFRCPISLDLMKSPVSLCTGVTYDRTSIQRWLDAGNNTCPATMQLLHTKELLPNHTLQRLINIWSDSVVTRPSSESLTSDQVVLLIPQIVNDLQNLENSSLLQVRRYLANLTSFAAESEENQRFLSNSGDRILPLVLQLIGKVKDLVFVEEIILFCNVLLKDHAKFDLEELTSEKFDLKASVLMCLKEGRLELRIAIAKLLHHLSSKTRSFSVVEDGEFYSELLRLITASGSNPEAIDASLSLLTRFAAQSRWNRSKIVQAGGVKVLATALATAELNAPATEKVLKLLEMASGSKEGRNEICGDSICVGAVMKKALKVSSAATEHAVRLLWSLCCLFGEKRAAAKVAEGNGMTKILLLLQSNCSPAVRQMCVDLMRCSYKSSWGVSWYDTKTSHIMPF